MTSGLIKCGGCGGVNEPTLFARNQPTCPYCNRKIEGRVFGAIWRPAEVVRADTLLVAEDASCFHHPQNKAACVCDGCGKFVCKLCDIEVHGSHLCPTCLESGVKKKKVAALEHARVLHGHVALALAILPLLMWYLTFLTAPAAIYVALRYWKRPQSVTGGTHIPHVFAIIIASLEILGWVLVIGGIAGRWFD